MTSWRENAPLQAQRELDTLLAKGLELAQEELAAHGEFYPFAVAIGQSGDMSLFAPQPDDAHERALSADLILTCQTKLRERRTEFRAAAVVSDVRLPQLGTDAIDVAAEHSEGIAIRALLPYSKKRFKKEITYGSLQAQANDACIWEMAPPPE